MRNAERTFIRIPGWEKYQHYKDRDAPWIKTYTRLLHDDDWLTLTGHRRGVLLGIWLMYASSNGRLTADHVRISHQLEVRVTPEDLAALNHAGFIEIVASTHKEDSASGLLATRAPAHSQEAEAEAETQNQPTNQASEARPPTPAATANNGHGWQAEEHEEGDPDIDLDIPAQPDFDYATILKDMPE